MATHRSRGIGKSPRNFLRPCLLLLLADAPSYGYDLLEHLRTMGMEQVDPGGLYRCLRAMEQEGLVSSWWEPSQEGPARRTYAVTPAGRAVLDDSIHPIRELAVLLDRFLDHHEALASRDSTASRAAT